MIFNEVSHRPMFTHHLNRQSLRSARSALLKAGRQVTERTRRLSEEWSDEFRHCCEHAGTAARSLRGLDPKSRTRTLLGMVKHFLRETYIDRPLQMVRGGLSRRAAWFMIVGQLPLVIGLAMIAIPKAVFSSPESRAYYHFADTLAGEAVSLLPVMLGLVTLTILLHLPCITAGHVGENH
jgi:hypothetical protein